MSKVLRKPWLIGALVLASLQAEAADYSFSGYGTLGYAKSNRSFGYQRFIDDGGSLKRDSLLGLQLDARFDGGFGGTVQIKAAPSLNREGRYDATVAWAFVSYRPNNDWLLRAGKLRIPLYLHSETTDVGATFDQARLPSEVYSISPTNDFTGASFRKTWSPPLGELTLDGYWGKTSTDARFFARDGILQARGAYFEPIKVTAAGLALTLRRDDDTYRLGFSQATARRVNGAITRRFPFVELLPGSGIGYHKFDDRQPPASVSIPSSDSTSNTAITVGAEVRLGGGFRVVGEYARRIARDTEIGPDTQGGYVSLFKQLSRWTVYGTYAYLRSTSGPLEVYEAVNNNRVPDSVAAFLPGGLPQVRQINAGQRVAADAIQAYDQRSWALGTSYALTPLSKLKAEFQRVNIGRVSALVDAPAGGDVHHTHINVVSLSYSFAF